MVLGADNIEIYFEATPDTANFNLDNIILDKFDSGKLVTELSVMTVSNVRRLLARRGQHEDRGAEEE